MREECKHFQSRTYGSGEVARFCRLDLAPEAPWRCPADCPKYERRMGDAGWSVGTLVSPPVELEPAAEEIWRYSRIDDIDLERWHPAAGDALDVAGADAAQSMLDAIGERAALVVTKNGAIASVERSDRAATVGLEVGPLGDAKEAEQ